MDLARGELIDVGVGQGAGFRENVTEGIVEVPGNESLIRVDEDRDIRVPIDVVIGVDREDAPHVGPGEKTQTLPGEGDKRQVVRVALLYDEASVVEISDLVRLQPGAVLPGELFADPPAHLAVIGEFRFPAVGYGDSDQLVLVV